MAFSIVGSLVFGFFAVAGISTVANGYTRGADPANFIILGVVGTALAVACVYLGFKTSRFIQTNTGTVTVANGHLVIEIRAFFAQPLYVPLQSIRVIAVDTHGPQGWDAQTGGGTFPVYRQDMAAANGQPQTAARSYYLQQSQFESGRLFQPNHYADWPNVAIILDQSMVINVDTRRGIFKGAVHEDIAVPGFVLRAVDSDAAAVVMAATGKLRDLYEVDVEHMNMLVTGNAMPLAPTPIYPVTGPAYSPTPAYPAQPPLAPQPTFAPQPHAQPYAQPQPQTFAQPAYQQSPSGNGQTQFAAASVPASPPPAARPPAPMHHLAPAPMPAPMPKLEPPSAPPASPDHSQPLTYSPATETAPTVRPAAQPFPQPPTSPPPPQAAAQ